jgi:hypothetical protein
MVDRRGCQLVDLGELISGAYRKKCASDKSATFSEGWDPPYMCGAYSICTIDRWPISGAYLTPTDVGPVGPRWAH